MTYKMIFCALLAFLVASCGGPRYVDYFPYHDDGKPKPRVAMIPVVNSCGCEVSWDISKELSQSIYYQLMNSGSLYVMAPEEVGPVWMKRDAIDFFGGDMSFARDFCGSDFIVAMELIEHSRNPALERSSGNGAVQCHPCNQVLTMKMRLKVIDVRCACPRVVLYEIVKAEYVIAPTRECVDFSQVCWGTNGYQLTPCGVLHQRMVCNVSERLEQVLWTVK